VIAPPPVQAAEVRILALGDSYTIGEGVAAGDAWPFQLAAMLGAKGLRVAAPTIIARTGWTTDELSIGIDDARPEGRYDLVTLLIGVNNQYRGRSIDDYRVQLRSLITRAVGFAGGRSERLLVISIPDWGVTPFAHARDRQRIAAEIDSFNAIGRDEAARAGVRYADVTTISRRAALEPRLIASDGLHPSRDMYTAWAELLLPAALEALR